MRNLGLEDFIESPQSNKGSGVGSCGRISGHIEESSAIIQIIEYE
jgi:hypothetical protein